MAKLLLIFLSFLTISLSNFVSSEESYCDKCMQHVLNGEYQSTTGRIDSLETQVETLKQKVQTLQTYGPGGVAFRASLTKPFQGASNNRRTIVFDDIELNIGNAYNGRHGNFVAPVNGLYLFTIQVCAIVRDSVVLDLMKNGATVGRILSGDYRSTDCNGNTFLLELNKGDDMYVSQGTYGTYVESVVKYGMPHFSGVLINAN